MLLVPSLYVHALRCVRKPPTRVAGHLHTGQHTCRHLGTHTLPHHGACLGCSPPHSWTHPCTARYRGQVRSVATGCCCCFLMQKQAVPGPSKERTCPCACQTQSSALWEITGTHSPAACPARPSAPCSTGPHSSPHCRIYGHPRMCQNARELLGKMSNAHNVYMHQEHTSSTAWQWTAPSDLVPILSLSPAHAPAIAQAAAVLPMICTALGKRLRPCSVVHCRTPAALIPAFMAAAQSIEATEASAHYPIMSWHHTHPHCLPSGSHFYSRPLASFQPT